MNYYVYFLKSLTDGNYYIGMSADVTKRLNQHNSGKTFSTKSRKPFILIYTEEYDSIEAARKRESYLKSYSGVAEKRKILENIGE